MLFAITAEVSKPLLVKVSTTAIVCNNTQGFHSSWKTWKMTTVFPFLEKYWNFIILLKILEKWE